MTGERKWSDRRTDEDAPEHYTDAEAAAWALGWNTAVAAHAERAAAGQRRKAEGIDGRRR